MFLNFNPTYNNEMQQAMDRLSLVNILLETQMCGLCAWTSIIVFLVFDQV